MDVARQFRQYMRLDRKRRDSGLTPTELAQWTGLKRHLDGWRARVSLEVAEDRPPSREEQEALRALGYID